MYTVYAIYNSKHDKLYIGQTADLKSRLRMHNDGVFKNSYTSRFDGEWKLVYSEEQENRQLVLLREKQLKSFRGREFIRQQIRRLAN